ncbi:hypothetical protein EIP91_004012 [Steccherinum ochraceum]|uniref:Cofilin n=1 Tax=Steccherinum ochraceum TaxID=92696 RepID=A0A4R0RC39_9APHY|nr:hypothetical protein EIP91_004012 [Steccherinum ochraceum]
MSSGVAVNAGCLEAFQELKLGTKGAERYKYIIFGLNSTFTEIEVVTKETQTSYESFLKDLPEDECRWAVYDVDFTKDGGKRNKLAFISWTPDNAPVKRKMVHASSTDALRRSLVGIAVEIQGTDYSEVAHETILEKASRGH